MLLQMALFHLFLWLSCIALYNMYVPHFPHPFFCWWTFSSTFIIYSFYESGSWRWLSCTHSCTVSYKATVNVMALICYGSHVTVWLVKDPFPISHVCWQYIVSLGLWDQDPHRPLWEVNRESLRERQKLKSYVTLIMEVISPQHWGILLVRSTLLKSRGLHNPQSPEGRASWQSS